MNDAFGYNNKICIVTGSTSPVAKSVIQNLVALGAKVYVLDIYECKTPGIEGYVSCDFSDINDIDAAFNQLPRNIDSFFGLHELTGMKSDYKTTFNTNFTSCKYMMAKYLRWRMGQGTSIMFLTSTAASNWQNYREEQTPYVNAKTIDEMNTMLEKLENISPSYFAYVFSKRCLSQYICEQSIDYARVGIRVNNVMPGFTNTYQIDDFYDILGGKEEILSNSKISYDTAKPTDIAYPCLFINSKLANFIAGEEMHIDYADMSLVRTNQKTPFANMPATKRKAMLNEKRRVEKLSR